MHDDPFKSIQTSKWMTRGWTYQEGLLSRRRLIFTDSQMYYECSGMYYWEALNVPLRDLHKADQSSFQEWLFQSWLSEDRSFIPNNVGLFPQSLGHPQEDITNRISEYCTRNLGNPVDMLNALQGVLRVFEKNDTFHCLGIPILNQRFPSISNQDVDLPSHPNSAVTGFCAGLLWRASNTHPFEPLKGRPVRRHGFPSWSWLGWSAHMAWNTVIIDFYERPRPSLATYIQIQVEDQLNHIVPFDVFLREKYIEMSPHLSNVLHVQGWASAVSTASLCAVCREEDPNYYGKLAMPAETPSFWTCYLERTPTLEPEECFGVMLLDNLTKGESYWMIIQEVGIDLYERLGLAMSLATGARPTVFWKKFRLG
jgi:hypothetical protein